MKFIKYPSIDNLTDELVEKQKNNETECYVTEKIHGSNYSFNCDGTKVECGKRTTLLGSDRNFMHSLDVYNKYRDKILELFILVSSSYENVKQIVLYGELYGGYYQVNGKVFSKSHAIQKGVFYSPYQHFMAFDLYVLDDKKYTRLARPVFEEFCKTIDIPFIPVLYKGTFYRCVEWSKLHFADNTTIPELLKEYPEPIENNIREGHIIRTTNNQFTVKQSLRRSVEGIR